MRLISQYKSISVPMEIAVLSIRAPKEDDEQVWEITAFISPGRTFSLAIYTTETEANYVYEQIHEANKAGQQNFCLPKPSEEESKAPDASLMSTTEYIAMKQREWMEKSPIISPHNFVKAKHTLVFWNNHLLQSIFNGTSAGFSSGEYWIPQAEIGDIWKLMGEEQSILVRYLGRKEKDCNGFYYVYVEFVRSITAEKDIQYELPGGK